MRGRHRWRPEQSATRRAKKSRLPPAEPRSAAAACNDHFTCHIFLLSLTSSVLLFFHRSLGSSHLSSAKKPTTSMDDRKKSPPATAAGAPAAAETAPNGYFSSVFSASPTANAKDAKQPDLYAMLNKQNFKGQNGGGIAGNGKSNGSPTKGRTANKDGKQFYPNESSESPYFGSSVHYGAREFYGSTPQKQGDESAKNYKEENPDGSLATRGDWWQGMSLLHLFGNYLENTKYICTDYNLLPGSLYY
ncbi:hypothetical protein ABZP36_029890 [Zizania latifolia]